MTGTRWTYISVQSGKCCYHTCSGRSADGNLGYHDGESERHHENQIDQKKNAAAESDGGKSKGKSSGGSTAKIAVDSGSNVEFSGTKKEQIKEANKNLDLRDNSRLYADANYSVICNGNLSMDNSDLISMIL